MYLYARAFPLVVACAYLSAGMPDARGCCGLDEDMSGDSIRKDGGLVGEWRIITSYISGTAIDGRDNDMRCSIRRKRMVFSVQGRKTEDYAYSVDESVRPSRVTLTRQDGSVFQAIYRFQDGELMLCLQTRQGGKIPQSFSMPEKPSTMALIVLKRQ